MCWVQLTEFPQSSLAVQVRSIPARPVQLTAAAASMWLKVTAPGQVPPLAVAEPVLVESLESPQASSTSDGQWITGGVGVEAAVY
jgi:hypothetical protein